MKIGPNIADYRLVISPSFDRYQAIPTYEELIYYDISP
jgi:hypothetical protein